MFGVYVSDNPSGSWAKYSTRESMADVLDDVERIKGYWRHNDDVRPAGRIALVESSTLPEWYCHESVDPAEYIFVPDAPLGEKLSHRFPSTATIL